MRWRDVMIEEHNRSKDNRGCEAEAEAEAYQ